MSSSCADRLAREFGVEVRVGQPDVISRESVSAAAEGIGRFLRDGDDEYIYGEVKVRVEPGERGSGVQYATALSPEQEQKARKVLDFIRSGVDDGVQAGVLQGDPLVDVKLTLTDVVFDDSRELTPLGYRIAVGMAIRDAMQKASPVVLQPVMKVEIYVPEEHLGDIIGDLSSRHGQIESVEDSGLLKVVGALAPLKSMFGYSTQLRSMTQGRGTFSMEFERFGAL